MRGYRPCLQAVFCHCRHQHGSQSFVRRVSFFGQPQARPLTKIRRGNPDPTTGPGKRVTLNSPAIVSAVPVRTKRVKLLVNSSLRGLELDLTTLARHCQHSAKVTI